MRAVIRGYRKKLKKWECQAFVGTIVPTKACRADSLFVEQLLDKNLVDRKPGARSARSARTNGPPGV